MAINKSFFVRAKRLPTAVSFKKLSTARTFASTLKKSNENWGRPTIQQVTYRPSPKIKR